MKMKNDAARMGVRPARARGGAVKPATRRSWLGHCTALVLAAGLPAWATAQAAGKAATATATTTAAAPAPVLLVVGDSLSAEYGLQRGSGWVALLEKRLAKETPGARLVNASISGDTTSGGRSRLAALLAQHKPSHVVIELGGNDALRGLPLKMTEDNLLEMTRAARASGARVLIVGMQVPPNYGRQYAQDFAGVFEKVARAGTAAFVPFLLKGVADGPDAEALFQADRIHPNEKAQERMLANVWPTLRTELTAKPR